MKRLLLTISLSFTALFGFSQARVVINNNGYIVIDNSAFVVIENSNTNALSTLGTGGNIVSEAEADVIKWEIGTAIGTYVIPWTTASGTKIPLSINKTTTGTGATAEFILSTWETATDMNAPWPSAVTNMNIHLPVTFDGSLFVVDRFWHIDALSYAAKPDVILSIGYDDAANELLGTNTIVEANLQAQRFNTGLSHWETYKLFGTVNTATNVVSGINAPAADFFEDWILVDRTNPLPVTLLSFEAQCKGNEVLISWSTETEVNNDYFTIEKSYDAQNYFEITTVQGAGNSSSTISYSYIDTNPNNGVTYYRLKQTDFDGAFTCFNITSVNCNPNGFEVNQIAMGENQLTFNILNHFDETINVFLYDYRGRIVSSQLVYTTEGVTPVKLSNLSLSSGIYMLSLVGDVNTFSTKLLKK